MVQVSLRAGTPKRYLSVATITSATAGELLKRLYSNGEIQDLINLTHPALEMAAREGSADLGGSGFYFPVRTKSAHGHAYVTEDQDVPGGRQSTVLQAVVSPTVNLGIVQLTGLSMAVSSGSAASFARVFDENTQQLLKSMSCYKEGALFRDGSGLLTQFNDTGAATAGPHIMDDVAYLREGMFVDIIDETATTRHNIAHEIVAVDWPARTVTFASAIAAGVADNDKLYLTGSQATTGALVSKEPIGLAGSLKATGTYLGIDRAAQANWRSSALTASQLFDEDILLRARTRLTQEAGVQLSGFGRSYKVLTHPSQVDTLFKLAIPRIQYSGNQVFDLGNSSNVKFGNMEFVTSYQCPSNVAYLGDWQYSNTLYTPGGRLHIDSEYNGSQLKWTANKDGGIVLVKEYCAFAVKNPVAFCAITALTDATR